MAGLIFNTGLDYLDTVAVATDCATWRVYLYSNNHTPVSADTLGSFTLITGFGLSFQTPGFTVGSASAGIKAIVSALMNFISTGAAGSTYGYIVTNGSGTTAIGGELFAGGPFSVNSAGLGVQLTATLTDQSP